MKKVCVITGGGSGMGLATAKLICEEGYYTILVGRTASKLEKAVNDLRSAGGNALGTVNINDAFYEVMAPGGCVIDTSSMSAYLAPQFVMPKGAYRLACTDCEKFIKKLVARASIAPKDARPGLAYAISKHFVIWFAKTDAARFGEKNVRCLSVTPGNFDTPMGALESGQADVFKKYSALKRNGKPEEIAALFALLLDERLGFLTGADILMDGGVVASGASGLSK